MDKEFTVNEQGIIDSIMCWNNTVFIILKTNEGIIKIKMPAVYCNNHKKLYVGDVIRIIGKATNYNNREDGILYSAQINKGNVQLLIGRNKKKNEHFDYIGEFCYIGEIQNVNQIDSDFYKIDFRECYDGDIHTIYVTKECYEKFLKKHTDTRRLVCVKGRSMAISAFKFYFDVPITYVKNYAVRLECI